MRKAQFGLTLLVLLLADRNTTSAQNDVPQKDVYRVTANNTVPQTSGKQGNYWTFAKLRSVL